MITVASLKDHSRKDLAEMAKKLGIAGWHSMRKEQLVRSLARKAKAKASLKNGASGGSKRAAGTTVGRSGSSRTTSSRSTTSNSSSNSRKRSAASGTKAASTGRAAAKPKTTRVARKIQQAHAQRERMKDLSACEIEVPQGGAEPSAARGVRSTTKDRVVLMVRDAYWLHVCWEISRQSVLRAKAAMAEQWHTAKPTLRLIQVETGTTTSTAERVVRDIDIHGGVRNWYVDVPQPPKSYRVDIGYKATDGRFHALSRSNVVTTPEPGSYDSLDENWRDIAEDYERVFALSGGYSDDTDSSDLQELFEERLRRPMGPNTNGRYGSGAERLLGRHRPFVFEVDAEMIVFGRTKPDAHLTLAGEPVKLRDDGSFTVRLKMPDRRQVLPVVAASSDGVEQRTIVLAIERNTKVMEPLTSENSD